MRNKKMLIFSGIALTIAVILIILVFCISPVKKISSYTKSDSSSSDSGLIKTLETIEFDKKSGDLNISFVLTEKDLNNILYEAIKNSIAVDGIETDIDENSIKLYINSHLLKIIPTQYMLEFTPSVEDNTLILNLKDVKVGRIPIPKGLVLNGLKENASNYLSIDKSNNSISINKNAVAPFKISGFNIQVDKLTLNLNYSIKSITDITNLFSHKMPEGVTNYVKKMFGN
ncbi:hypothetical protein [Clostridium arbusti]|uniref:hypothetical protein n=1 Tax=Clostridium arbusti TaxID=1137848 RepID=UPI000288B226|nr:hypothetical protein [Clostridium arbusti]